MRILKISDVYFPRINGVSTSIQTFSDEFVAMEHEVHLLAPHYDLADKPGDFSISRIKSRGVPLDPEDRMMHYQAILRQTSELKKRNFDILHIHTPFIAHYAGLKLSKSLGLPCVATYHTLFEEYLYHYIPYLPRSVLRLLARRFSCWQCNQVNGIIAPSSVIVDVLQQYGVNKPIEIIPTGIHSKHFKQGNRDRFLKKFGLPNDRPILLNVSRIAHEKHIDRLLYCVQNLKKTIPNILLIIAGEGPAKTQLKKLSTTLCIEANVHFVGYLDRDSTLIDCYASADIFLFSSTTETQGLVLLEAMSAGTPVVSVAEMGTKDVLNGYSKLGITDGSIDDFTNKITFLLNHRQQLENLSRHATKHVQQWDSLELAQKMIQFYKQTLTIYKRLDYGRKHSTAHRTRTTARNTKQS